MNKLHDKKFMAAALTVGMMALSAAPLSASAQSGYQNGTEYNGQYNQAQRLRDVSVNRREARDIAQDIFPQREIRDVTRQNDGRVTEFRVRFEDGSRVDVRQSNGRVTFVRSSRAVNERQAERIAEAVFPRKTVRNVVLRGDSGDREYRVRFTDGSRVDVRRSNGMILDIRNGNV